MKTILNTELLENRSKWAKRIAPLTMLFLFGGLITNFMSFNRPELLQYTVALLAVGFLLSIVSSYLVNNWVREPRTDQAIATTLKKFGNDFVVFNYTSVAHHILLTPTRLYVMIVKRQDGEFDIKDRRVSRKFSFIRVLRFFAEEGMGAPISEALSSAHKLKKLLEKKLPATDIPEIEPILLFSHKDAQLNRNNPAISVFNTAELKVHLHETNRKKIITPELRKTLIELLGNGHPEVKMK